MTLLLERDRVDARSRVQKAEKYAAATEKRYADAIAEADVAFDRWEAEKPGSPRYDDAKRDALAKGERQTRECNTHIGAVTLLTEAQKELGRHDDPAELERRLELARVHDEWWRSGT